MCVRLFASSKIFNFRRVKVYIFVFAFLVSSCGDSAVNPKPLSTLPNMILWAWERPENLEFIDSKKFGVAFLAQTIEINGAEVAVLPRRQPLKVTANTKLIAVTRIETSRQSEKKAALTDPQLAEISLLILKTLELKNVSAIQIDFDAAVSEREFYRKLLTDLRQKLSKDVQLSMTALASFCIDDDWIKDLPVDEVVPMIFRLGADEKPVKTYLANGNDFKIPICQTSYGIAVDETIKANFPNSRRVYFFNIRSWSEKDVEGLKLPSNN